MREVIRYLASYTPYEGLDLNGQCARHDGDYFVSAADFDRLTGERDAALALIKTHEDCMAHVLEREKELQQRLTAADERAEVLETALHKIKARLDAYAEAEMRMPEPSVEVCQMIADAALKPAQEKP